MDPYDEERLRNEVIYLHHLWHQGPPSPPNPNPFPIPYISRRQPPHHQCSVNLRPPYPFLPYHPRPLQPRTSTTFKKNQNKNKKPRKRRDSKKPTQPDPYLNSGSEWPMPAEDSAPMVSGWPPLVPRSTPATRPLSAEEKERIEALQVQYKARQACREFLFDSDGDDDNDGVEDDEDDMEEDDESEEIEDFFSKLFEENNELSNYYEKCWEGGEFRCLVCGVADNKNAGKKFRDCVGLVQHSMSISRTKKKRAHRAFGNAVCKVLGWDINRLPTIVIKKDEKPAEGEGETKENAGDGKDGSESYAKSDDKVSVEHLGEPVKQDVEVVHETIKQVIENFSKEDDFNKNVENFDEKISDARSDKEGGTYEVSNESLVSDVEWVCKSHKDAVSSAASGWLGSNTESNSCTHSLSAKELAHLAVLQLQYKALEACQEFLVGNVGSDCDENDKDDEEEDKLLDEYDSEECEEFKFFLGVFTKDSELRRYYENNYREGEFYCLVCGGIGKKVWKRFKDCFALLQHSTAIQRTKRKRAHRAYAQVICRVLGWDIDRLPAIVSKGEPLGSSLAGQGKLCGEPDKSADDHVDDSVVL